MSRNADKILKMLNHISLQIRVPTNRIHGMLSSQFVITFAVNEYIIVSYINQPIKHLGKKMQK
jgi:hypothetical protein